MNKIIGAGRWLFLLSFSFYVFLHLALPDVGVHKYVPSYLPWPYFWNYLTGVAMLVFIISGSVGKFDKLAALLMTVYLLLVILLIHAPKAAGDPIEMLNVFRMTNMMGGTLMYAGAFARDKRLSFSSPAPEPGQL